MSSENSGKKDNAVYIEHMLDSILRIDEYVESKELFYDSHLVQDAVVRNLQVMAESSQHLSEEIKNKYPDIPWDDISGFRNVLVHDYLGIDLDVIWSVVEQELPGLEKVLNKIYSK
jgi:uncharacterized protein with HEPN domain